MDEPRVTVSDKLAAYLAKKGHRYILTSVATCKSCGGAVENPTRARSKTTRRTG